MRSFQESLTENAKTLNTALTAFLKSRDFGVLNQPMRYAVLSNGKRLRGFLVRETANMYHADKEQALLLAMAVEILHSYSLVHDDLPAMDDDDLRRGQPTLHVKWDEATAILTGDALQALAFELVADETIEADIAMTLVRYFAQSTGGCGMVLGQALDIAAETRNDIGLEDIMRIQSYKTGALIEWSAMAGAILAREDPRPLKRYARHLGLAFQIYDDILDVIGSEDSMGKRLQKDAIAGKATFVSLLGVEAAQKRAQCEVDAAIEELAQLENTEHLKALAHFVIARQR